MIDMTLLSNLTIILDTSLESFVVYENDKCNKNLNINYYVYAKNFMISWKREIKFAPVYATRPNSCIL